MATRLEPVEPLELASIRDDVRAPRVWSASATVALCIAVLALAVAVSASALTGHDDLGPGRVLGPVVVGAWCLAAMFVALRRPREPLATVMATGALVGALALLGAALVSRGTATDGARDVGAGLRAFGVALLPALALHLTLGLPDGALATRGRRVAALLGYAGALIAGAVMVADRPDLPLLPITVLALAAAPVGLIGYFARCRAARTAQERARLLWPAWGIVVAAAVSIATLVLHELVDWPGSVREVAVASTVLVPLSLAFAASERIAIRIDRLLVHTITLAGLVVMVAGVLPAHRARARTRAHRRRADPARAVDARGRGGRAALGARARADHRGRDPARLRRTPRPR